MEKHGRHTLAFILLLLVDAPCYGALLLTRLQTEIPFCFCDSAIVYRSLQKLVENGSVESNWETKESDQPRKWYTITPKGMQDLQEQAEDIRQRYANFEFFLSHYKAIRQEND